MTIAVSYTVFPGQDMNITIPFSSMDLPTGVTLTGTPAVTAEILMGNDVASNALNGVPTIGTDSRSLLVPVRGSVDWADYLITVTCSTTNVKYVVVGFFALKCRAIPPLE